MILDTAWDYFSPALDQYDLGAGRNQQIGTLDVHKPNASGDNYAELGTLYWCLDGWMQ